jgi:hypothetical protein
MSGADERVPTELNCSVPPATKTFMTALFSSDLPRHPRAGGFKHRAQRGRRRKQRARLRCHVRDMIRTRQNEVVNHAERQRRRQRPGDEPAAEPLRRPHEGKSGKRPCEDDSDHKDRGRGRQIDVRLRMRRTVDNRHNQVRDDDGAQPRPDAVA